MEDSRLALINKILDTNKNADLPLHLNFQPHRYHPHGLVMLLLCLFAV
jgi:hypothetical protein